LHGWVSFTFLSHKILRWLCPFALLLALLTNLLLCHHLEFLCLFIAQILFYGVAIVAGWLPRGPRLFRYPRLATMFTMMNAALFVGFFRWLRGGHGAAWKRTERTAISQTPPTVDNAAAQNLSSPTPADAPSPIGP
jgi:hypothetical protein